MLYDHIYPTFSEVEGNIGKAFNSNSGIEHFWDKWGLLGDLGSLEGRIRQAEGNLEPSRLVSPGVSRVDLKPCVIDFMDLIMGCCIMLDDNCLAAALRYEDEVFDPVLPATSIGLIPYNLPVGDRPVDVYGAVLHQVLCNGPSRSSVYTNSESYVLRLRIDSQTEGSTSGRKYRIAHPPKSSVKQLLDKIVPFVQNTKIKHPTGSMPSVPGSASQISRTSGGSHRKANASGDQSSERSKRQKTSATKVVGSSSASHSFPSRQSINPPRAGETSAETGPPLPAPSHGFAPPQSDARAGAPTHSMVSQSMLPQHFQQDFRLLQHRDSPVPHPRSPVPPLGPNTTHVAPGYLSTPVMDFSPDVFANTPTAQGANAPMPPNTQATGQVFARYNPAMSTLPPTAHGYMPPTLGPSFVGSNTGPPNMPLTGQNYAAYQTSQAEMFTRAGSMANYPNRMLSATDYTAFSQAGPQSQPAQPEFLQGNSSVGQGHSYSHATANPDPSGSGGNRSQTQPRWNPNQGWPQE